MASFLQHQNVMTNAMRKFRMKQILEYMFHLLNISATFFLFWRFSGFTITLQAFWHAYAVLIPLFTNPFYAFLLLNAIIFILYALPNKNNNASVSTPVNSDQNRKRTTPKTESVCVEDTSVYLKAESSYMENTTVPKVESMRVNNTLVYPKPKAESSHVKNTSALKAEAVSVRVKDTLFYPKPKTKTESLVEKQKVCNSEVGESSPIFEEKTVTAVTETTTAKKCCTSTTLKTNGVEERSYRRVQSENHERRVGAGPKRELKRFGTGLKKKEPERRFCYVEQLSKDEFNRAIEDFIAKHKRSLLEEQIR